MACILRHLPDSDGLMSIDLIYINTLLLPSFLSIFFSLNISVCVLIYELEGLTVIKFSLKFKRYLIF
jgi:hypothetical protein